MSEYLKQRVITKCDNLINITTKDVSYETIVKLNCTLHGQYQKTVKQILYKNPRCPECTRISKSKKLSEIGKTRVGEKNNFYGHKHSKETRKKLSDAWSGDTSKRRRKISETMKSKEYKEKMKQLNLEKFGCEHPFQNPEIQEKRKQTFISNYGTEHPMKSEEVRNKVSAAWQNKSENEKANIIEKIKVTKLERYNDENYNNREKAAQTCLDRFGTTVPNQYGSEQFIRLMTKKYGENWTSTSSTSQNEKMLLNFVMFIYSGKILPNDRYAIYPYELDIYLPELNLAIEYNGTYWHSIEAGTPIDYHLKKSLLCRNKNIRLIHIYEFEDIEQQKQLLKNLILGQDTYSRNDFNKNNLITEVPKPEIIYSHRLTIYGAGKLL